MGVSCSEAWAEQPVWETAPCGLDLYKVEGGDTRKKAADVFF